MFLTIPIMYPYIFHWTLALHYEELTHVWLIKMTKIDAKLNLEKKKKKKRRRRRKECIPQNEEKLNIYIYVRY